MNIDVILDSNHNVLLTKRDTEHYQNLYLLGKNNLQNTDTNISFYLIDRQEKKNLFSSNSEITWLPINSLTDNFKEDISSEQLYDSYCQTVLNCYNPKKKNFQVWSFGDNKHLADELLELVLIGKKTGTAGSVIGYEYFDEGIPEVGDLSIITNWEGIPKCVIETTKINITPFSEVTAEFAQTEGEGDLSLDYWREGHWNYFSREAKITGVKPSMSMPIVCENFKVLYQF